MKLYSYNIICIVSGKSKPKTAVDDSSGPNNYEDMEGDSYFFSYFMTVCVVFILGYVGYHNKQKVNLLPFIILKIIIRFNNKSWSFHK